MKEHQASNTIIKIREFPSTGFVTIKQIIGPGNPIPVSRSGWLKGVANGRFPRPRKIGGKTVWVVAEIIEWIEQIKAASPAKPPIAP